MYRDELRYLSASGRVGDGARMSLGLLKEKAELEEKLGEAKLVLERELTYTDRQIDLLG